MKWNKVVFKFVSISFSILVALLVVVGLIELGSYCYDFGYRVFTESPVDEAPGRDVTLSLIHICLEPASMKRRSCASASC